MRKALVLFLSLVALQGIALLAAAPMWIPEWEFFPWIVAGNAYLISIFLAFRLIRLAYQKMKSKLDPTPRTITTVALSLAIGGWMAFAGLVTATFAAGGIFAPTYVTQHEFPDHSTTLYIYDGSFLEPQTDIYVRTGIWPWMHLVTRIPEASLWKAKPETEGDWVILGSFRYNLTKGTQGN